MDEALALTGEGFFLLIYEPIVVKARTGYSIVQLFENLADSTAIQSLQRSAGQHQTPKC